MCCKGALVHQLIDDLQRRPEDKISDAMERTCAASSFDVKSRPMGRPEYFETKDSAIVANDRVTPKSECCDFIHLARAPVASVPSCGSRCPLPPDETVSLPHAAAFLNASKPKP